MYRYLFLHTLPSKRFKYISLISSSESPVSRKIKLNTLIWPNKLIISHLKTSLFSRMGSFTLLSKKHQQINNGLISWSKAFLWLNWGKEEKRVRKERNSILKQSNKPKINFELNMIIELPKNWWGLRRNRENNLSLRRKLNMTKLSDQFFPMLMKKQDSFRKKRKPRRFSNLREVKKNGKKNNNLPSLFLKNRKQRKKKR